jgi:hypothetical protein
MPKKLFGHGVASATQPPIGGSFRPPTWPLGVDWPPPRAKYFILIKSNIGLESIIKLGEQNLNLISVSNQTDPFRIIKPRKHLNINIIYDLPT